MKKKKGFSERGFEEETGGKRETLGKPYPREKRKNEGKTEKHKNNTRIQESKQSQAVHSHTKKNSEGEESARVEKTVPLSIGVGEEWKCEGENRDRRERTRIR